MKPPTAASTCSGTSMPRSACRRSSSAASSSIGSYRPTWVEPSTPTTPMVFSSQQSATRDGSRVNAGSWIGMYRGSTSQYRQNLGQQVWTALPITRLGRPAGRPAARLRSRQRNFIASPPSIAASLDPAVEQPAPRPSGSFQRLSSMLTQRRSSSAVRGYWSWSMRLRSSVSAMRSRACGSIQVVQNVARLSRALPSMMSSSRMRAAAASAVIGPSGRCRRGTPPAGTMLW